MSDKKLKSKSKQPTPATKPKNAKRVSWTMENWVRSLVALAEFKRPTGHRSLTAALTPLGWPEPQRRP